MGNWVNDDDTVNQDKEHSKWNRTRGNEYSIKYNGFEMPVRNYSLDLENKSLVEKHVNSISPHMTLFKVLEVDDLLSHKDQERP